MTTVWVFMGEGARFPAAVFDDEDSARRWVGEHSLTGVLTEYPVGVSVLSWAAQLGFVDGAAAKFSDPKVVQRFTSAHQRHVHFVAGREGGSE